MKRGYTTADYYEMMDRISEYLPGAAVSSDFIVGFCGETDEEFQATVEMVRRCRFKNSFIFQYSVRPGTKGAELYADDVPAEIKHQRNLDLLEVQNQISLEDNLPLLGTTVEVLVEGPSKWSVRKGQTGEFRQMTGRTRCDRILVWDGNMRQTGQFLGIQVTDVYAFTLMGRVETHEIVPDVVQLMV
jgi:tRNA-2-methylthio-N6-dimethylallyladenosine synthase